MEIRFATHGLERVCQSEQGRLRRWGPQAGRRVGQRLDEFRAARFLADLRHAPGNHHELKGDRRGQLAVSVGGLLRLIYRPVVEDPPATQAAGLDWSQVTAVEILAVEDYHG
jgi:toxin HigB-1